MTALRAATDAQILAVEGVTKRHLTSIRKVIAAPPEVAHTSPKDESGAGGERDG
jgi:excinuclease ABC subunit C